MRRRSKEGVWIDGDIRTETQEGVRERDGMCVEMKEREGETLLCFGFLFNMCVTSFSFYSEEDEEEEGPQGKGRPWIDTKRITTMRRRRGRE